MSLEVLYQNAFKNKKEIKIKNRFLVVGFLIIAVLFFYLAVNTALDYVYPNEYVKEIERYSKEYELDENLIKAIIKTESRYRSQVVSNKGAIGLMQITEGTGKWAFEEMKLENYKKENLFNPDVNIKVGCWYMSRLLKRYDGDLTLALSAYNAGSGNVSKWLKNSKYSEDGKTLSHIPFKETRNYVKKVTIGRGIYRAFR